MVRFASWAFESRLRMTGDHNNAIIVPVSITIGILCEYGRLLTFARQTRTRPFHVGEKMGSSQLAVRGQSSISSIGIP